MAALVGSVCNLAKNIGGKNCFYLVSKQCTSAKKYNSSPSSFGRYALVTHDFHHIAYINRSESKSVVTNYYALSDVRYFQSKNPKSSTGELKGLADEILKGKIKSDDSEEGKKSAEEKPGLFSKGTAAVLGGVCVMLMAGGIGFSLISQFGTPELDEDGNEVKDKYSDMPTVKQYFFRAKNYFDRPSREKLLPEPLTEPYYQPPFTLLIELTGVLVHPDWTFGTGWRFKKRPGVEFFLQQVGPPLFEVVIFTNEQAFTAFPIIDSLDPNGYVMYRLFRDATRYNKSGHHVKDLSCLNRDLSKVIMVDCNANSVELNLENSIVLKKWNGEDQDRGLIDLAIFLRTIVGNEVEDVRPILEYYSQFDDPIAVFKEKQRQLAEQTEEREKQMQNQNPTLARSWSSSLFKHR